MHISATQEKVRRIAAATIIILNIPSYAGGRLKPSGVNIHDGRCDVYRLRSGMHMGLCMAGLRAAQRIEQTSGFSFTLPSATYLQADGEPMLVQAGTYHVAHAGTARLLMR
jgi:hypothetical protein